MKFRLTVVAALAVLVAAGVLTQGGVEAGGGGRNNVVKPSNFFRTDPANLADNIFSNNQLVKHLENTYSISGNKIIITNAHGQAKKVIHTFSKKIVGGIYSFEKIAIVYTEDEESGDLFSLNLIDGVTKSICPGKVVRIAVGEKNSAYMYCQGDKIINYDLKNNKIAWTSEEQPLNDIYFSNTNFLVGTDQNFYMNLYLRSSGKKFSFFGIPIMTNSGENLYGFAIPSIGVPIIADDESQYEFRIFKVSFDKSLGIRKSKEQDFSIGPRKGCEPASWLVEFADSSNSGYMPNYASYEFYAESRLWFSQKDSCGPFLAGINFDDQSVIYKGRNNDTK